MKTVRLLYIMFIIILVACKKEAIQAPGFITGPSNVCPGDSGATYSIASVEGAIYYTWTVPQDAAILSGQGTISITIAFGSSSGKICVRANNKTSTSDISCIDVSQGGVTGQWCQERDLPATKRNQAVAFSISGKGYVTTGSKGSGITPGECLQDLWEYNPISNTWIQKADFGGAARFGAVAFVIDNYAYVGSGTSVAMFHKDFWQYNPQSNSWVQIADCGNVERADAFSFSISGKGYVCGGTDYSNNRNDLWEYSPATNQWIEKTPLPGNKSYSDGASFSINEKGYIGTGLTDDGNVNKEFWEFDPFDTSNGFDSNNNPMGGWTQKADFGGVGRSNPIGFSIDGKGYIGLGADLSDYPKTDIWEYNPANNQWKKKEDFIGVARSCAVCFEIDSKVFAGTGYINPTTNALNDFWVYKP